MILAWASPFNLQHATNSRTEQRQTAVTAYFSIEQLLLFFFVRQGWPIAMPDDDRGRCFSTNNQPEKTADAPAD